MVMIAMGAAVGLRHLYAAIFDLIDRSDMNAIGANDFHMLRDPAEIGHVILLSSCFVSHE